MKFIRHAAVAAVVAAAVAVPLSAQAASALHYDATGDVMMVTTDPNTGTDTTSPAPGRVQGDISRAKISFTNETVRVSVAYRGLAKAGMHIHFFRLVTSKLERQVGVIAMSGMWQGQAFMATKAGGDVKCTGLKATIDYTNKLVVLQVPRSCLGNPGAVRVGIGFATQTSPDSNTAYVDDAFNPQPSSSDTVTLSTKVYRN